MAARQRIVRIRREYNQWVANQTLEDYALRFTAKAARRWSPARVANTALGGISFLALEAIGGTVTIGYGFTNAVAAIVLVSLLIFATSVPISFYAARDGVDIDLLTRGAGFGYIGSTVTSLIYASFTFIFFAIEAVILAAMLEACFGIPPPIGYILCSVAVVPLVTHGITFISRVQLWSQPLWVVLQMLPFVVIAVTATGSMADWTEFPGTTPGADGGFKLVLFGAAASVVFSLIAQIGEQADYLRFLPERQPGRAGAGWWAAMLAGGPGWIVIGCLKLLAGSFLACLAVASGIEPGLAKQPNTMYRVAFGHVVHTPVAALALTACFVVISQLKINMTNAYAGSIGWSNFFSRLTHSHPGRVVWLVFNIGIALLLMELGIYQAIEHTLVLYSAVAAAWVGALVADLVVNKPLGFSPPHIEFKRAHLYDINPVGCGAMVLAVAAGALAYSGAVGAIAEAFSPFVAFATAFVAAPLIAWATNGRYYLARKPRAHWAKLRTLDCAVCENPFEPEDIAFCPAYGGAICSLCCSLDARCHDMCKPHARLSAQILGSFETWMPSRARALLAGPLGRWAGLLVLLAAVIGVVLVAIFGHMAAAVPGERRALAQAFLDGVRDPDAGRRRLGVAALPGPGNQARGPAGDPAPNRPAPARDRGPQAHGRAVAKGERGRGIRQPRQKPLRRRHQPRAAQPAERHPRLRPAPGARHQHQPRPAGKHQNHPQQRRPHGRADRRLAGHLQDRGRADRNLSRRGPPRRVPATTGEHVPAAGRSVRHRLRVQQPRPHAGRGLYRRTPVAADPHQPAVQRGEVHPVG